MMIPFARGVPPLRRDLRLDLFAIVFALGTIAHELEFVLEVCRVGPLSEYMERWSRVRESTNWTSEVGLGLHGAVALLSFLLLIVPHRRELLTLLAVAFLASQLASPHRIASHSGLMAAALAVVLLLALAEWGERAIRRRSAWPHTDWYRWTLIGLAWVSALTYVFAVLYKLNATWFSSRGAAPAFLVSLVAPFLEWLGDPPSVRSMLVIMAIYGTLVIELALPLLLVRARTRPVGCLIGLLFHMPMVARGVVDFPLLILATYPAFLTLRQAREMLDAILARPTITRLAGSTLLGGYGLWAVARMGKRGLYDSPGLPPFVSTLNDAATWVTFVLFGYVAFALGPWVLGPTAGTAEPAIPNGGTPSKVALPQRPRSAWTSRLALGIVALVGWAFVYLNVAGFFGLPSAGPMSMYSGVKADRSNHLLMRGRRLTETFAYVSITRFDPAGVPTREAAEFSAFTRWLRDQKRPPRVSLNFLRYHLARVCRSAPGVTVAVELRMPDGNVRPFADACAEPTMLRYWTVLTAPPCAPVCDPALRRWASGDRLAPCRRRTPGADGQPARARRRRPNAVHPKGGIDCHALVSLEQWREDADTQAGGAQRAARRQGRVAEASGEGTDSLARFARSTAVTT